MGSAKPLDLPSIKFPTKTKAIDFFREMLHRYIDGQDIDQADHILLYELLLMHPDVDDKIGNGVMRFFREKPRVTH